MNKADAVANQLKETFTIVVPKETIQTRINQIIYEKAKAIKMPGFRPGKVPLEMIQSRYSDQAHKEAIDYFIQVESSRVIKENNIRSAVQPTFTIDEYSAGKDLIFKLNTEKLPKIELKPYSEIKIERIESAVTDEDVEEEYKALISSITPFDPADENVVASYGHRALLNVSAKIGKKNIPERSMESGLFYLSDKNEETKEFSRQLALHKVGEKFDYSITLPSDYNVSELANKTIHMFVEYLGLEIPAKRDVSEAEILSFYNFKTMEEFKSLVRARVENNRNKNLHLYHKRLILDKLSSLYDFDLPPSLVSTEFDAIWKRLLEELENSGVSENEKKVTEDLKKEYLDIAQRRVRLGLIISEIATKEKIHLTSELISRLVIREAMNYPGHEKQVIEYYKKNNAALEALTSPELESIVIKFLMDQMVDSPKVVKSKDLQTYFEGVLPGFEKQEENTKDESKEKSSAKKTKKSETDEKPKKTAAKSASGKSTESTESHKEEKAN